MNAALAPTLIAADSALDATIAAPSSAVVPVASVPEGVLEGGVASRTTVLPRLERSTGASQLVHQDRPRYQRQGTLGAGGMGEVIKSVDNDIDRVVAIKRMRPEVRSPWALARFVEEIRTVGLLEHPNIVPIHDVGVDEEGQYFFVMKYVEGETLEHILERLRQGDRLYHAVYGYERRVEIFMGILDAVAYAHSKGILHRDLKPANVMVGPFGEVMVMDWGLAQRMGQPLQEEASGVTGTPHYMSPEQARGEVLDVRSDIYALCVMLHEMLCLEHYLHDAPTVPAVLVGVQATKPKAPSFVSNPHQPPAPMDLSHFVRKGYEKDPAARYQTVHEMITRLRRRAEGYIPIQCHVTFLKRATTAWTHVLDRHPLMVSAALVMIMLWAVVATVWVARG